MPDFVIVSRHPAALQFLSEYLAEDWDFPASCSARKSVLICARQGKYGNGRDGMVEYSVPVLAEARPEDVRGKYVLGNLPFSLAVHAAAVGAVEFDEGKAPRGQEYTTADMEAAGARVRWYVVQGGTDRPRRELRGHFSCSCPAVGEESNGWRVVEAYPSEDGHSDHRWTVEMVF